MGLIAVVLVTALAVWLRRKSVARRRLQRKDAPVVSSEKAPDDPVADPPVEAEGPKPGDPKEGQAFEDAVLSARELSAGVVRANVPAAAVASPVVSAAVPAPSPAVVLETAPTEELAGVEGPGGGGGNSLSAQAGGAGELLPVEAGEGEGQVMQAAGEPAGEGAGEGLGSGSAEIEEGVVVEDDTSMQAVPSNDMLLPGGGGSTAPEFGEEVPVTDVTQPEPATPAAPPPASVGALQPPLPPAAAPALGSPERASHPLPAPGSQGSPLPVELAESSEDEAVATGTLDADVAADVAADMAADVAADLAEDGGRGGLAAGVEMPAPQSPDFVPRTPAGAQRMGGGRERALASAVAGTPDSQSRVLKPRTPAPLPGVLGLPMTSPYYTQSTPERRGNPKGLASLLAAEGDEESRGLRVMRMILSHDGQPVLPANGDLSNGSTLCVS